MYMYMYMYIHVHVYYTCTMYMVQLIISVVFLTKVYVLKALGAEIVRTPTTAAFNSAGQEIIIFVQTILSVNVLYTRNV